MNGKAKHTPGPWTATLNLEHDGEWSSIIDNRGFVVSGVPRLDIASEESKANARLIAAAPEMLEALDYLFNSVRLEVSSEWNDKIRELIRKAKGGER